jgi:hypothetical protein
MNTLYRIIYPGSYLPWGVILLYYCIQLELFNTLVVFFYICLALVMLSHTDHLDKDVVYWHRLFNLGEFALASRLIVFNIYKSNLLGVVAAVLVFSVGVNDNLLQKLTQPPFHAVCLLFLCSVSNSIIQMIAAVVLIGLRLHLWKSDWDCGSDKEMEEKLCTHFNLKIIESYMVFLLEWASITNIHWSSLPIIASIACGFQAYVYYNVPYVVQDLEDFYMQMHVLPEGYPMPLDFNHAREWSKIAKKVFKHHSI